MATWGEIAAAEPEFAAHVRARFESGRHKTIATTRADGSPRISGIECEFTDDGQLSFGSMAASRKGADLHRDPRFALHSPTASPVEGHEADWPGEAKIAGRAVPTGVLTADEPDQEVPDGEGFTGDISEVAFTHLNPEGTLLVVEWWTPDGGLRQVERQ